MKKFKCLLIIVALTALAGCENYGNKVSKDYVEVYYKDGVSKDKAQQVLDYLYPSWNDSGNMKSVQLVRLRDTVTFRMVVDQAKMNSIGKDIYFLLANELSTGIFEGKPVNLELTDEAFKKLSGISFQKVAQPDYGIKRNAGHIDVFAAGDSLTGDAEQLAIFLNRLDAKNTSQKSFRLERKDDSYVVYMATAEDQSRQLPDAVFYDLAAMMSDSALQGRPLILRLTDNRFQPTDREFRYR